MILLLLAWLTQAHAAPVDTLVDAATEQAHASGPSTDLARRPELPDAEIRVNAGELPFQTPPDGRKPVEWDLQFRQRFRAFGALRSERAQATAATASREAAHLAYVQEARLLTREAAYTWAIAQQQLLLTQQAVDALSAQHQALTQAIQAGQAQQWALVALAEDQLDAQQRHHAAQQRLNTATAALHRLTGQASPTVDALPTLPPEAPAEAPSSASAEATQAAAEAQQLRAQLQGANLAKIPSLRFVQVGVNLQPQGQTAPLEAGFEATAAVTLPIGAWASDAGPALKAQAAASQRRHDTLAAQHRLDQAHAQAQLRHSREHAATLASLADQAQTLLPPSSAQDTLASSKATLRLLALRQEALRAQHEAWLAYATWLYLTETVP